MPRNDKAPALASLTKAQLIALLTASPAAPSEASQHYAAKDIPCTLANCPHEGGFRTQKGLDWHIANVKHTK